MLTSTLKALEGITPTRSFNLMYVIIDTIFCLVLLGLLIYKKKYVTLAWAIFGGVLYYLVDYGYFYWLSGSRSVSVNGVVSELNTAMVLLWMSMSYGITNFLFIWVCLNKDKYMKEFLILIIGWWLIAPSFASLGGEANIITYRTTGAYHGYMALILIVGYLGLILYNFITHKKMINLIKLILIGFFVQFSWELALLINGIRPMDGNSIMTLLVNSVLETNLGMPYIYLINVAIYKKYNEDFSRKSNDINKNLEIVNQGE